MLRGFVLNKDGSLEPVESIESVHQSLENGYAALWIDVFAPTLADLHSFGALFGLDEESLDDCVTGEQRPRVDEFEGYLFHVLYGALGPDSEIEFSPRKVAIYLGKRFVISVHREPLRTTQKYLSLDERRTRRLLERGAEFIYYTLVDSVVDNYVLVARDYEQRLEALDERSLESTDPAILDALSEARREIIDLRNTTHALHETLTPFARGEYDYVSRKLHRQFQHILDHSKQATEILDGNRELLISIRENYRSIQANEMNAVMKTLTIFATITLPLTLLAGIYGMNVPLWPGPESPYAFWTLLGVMGTTALVMLAFFRYMKWL